MSRIIYDNLHWDSIVYLLLISLINLIMGILSDNHYASVFYYGCALGIAECVMIHEGGLYIAKYISENMLQNIASGGIESENEKED
jgi:hypothetical protein